MTENKYEYIGRRPHGTIVGRSNASPWEKAALHRAQLMRMLPAVEQGRSGILCVFGVGDGTSLDFRGLLDRFHEVHLIDRNEESIQKAVRSQNLDDRQRVFHKTLDLTGADHFLESREPIDDSALEEIFQRIEQHALPDLGQFDVVLSNSLLPQLTIQAARRLPDDPQQMAKLIRAIRLRHVDLLLQHASPGGQVLLVMDVVSSQTLPVLSQSPGEVSQLMTATLQHGNFFPGGHPTLIDKQLREQQDRLERIDAAGPWIRETADEQRISIAFRAILKTAW